MRPFFRIFSPPQAGEKRSAGTRSHRMKFCVQRGLGNPQQAAPGAGWLSWGIACYNGDTPQKGGRPPYAAAHTQATMGGNRTDEALLELSTLVLANCQPALPLRRSICAG